MKAVQQKLVKEMTLMLSISSSNRTPSLNTSQPYQRFYLTEPDITKLMHGQSVVIFVQSGHLNTRNRQLIRQTWANPHYYVNNERPFVFFVSGQETQCGCAHVKVMEEISINKDILLLDIKDTYDNLTIKGILTMAWIERALNNSYKYVIKTDDDVMLNTFRWITVLNTQNFFNSPRFIVGYVWPKPIVKRTGRYKVSPAEYPGQYYPAFCTGSGYAMSREAMAVILKKVPNVPFLKRDDPFITGLLAVEGKVPRYTFKRNTYVIYPGDFRGNVSWQETMLVHGANESTWYKVWNMYVSSSRFDVNVIQTSVSFVTSEWFAKTKKTTRKRKV